MCPHEGGKLRHMCAKYYMMGHTYMREVSQDLAALRMWRMEKRKEAGMILMFLN